MGTANTMGCLTEALGMSLPDAGAIPAVHADRLRLAEQSGEAICHLVKQGITARNIISKYSLENAVKVVTAMESMQSFLLLRNFIFDKNYTTTSNGIEANGTDVALRGKRYSLCDFICTYVTQNNHSSGLGVAYEFL